MLSTTDNSLIDELEKVHAVLKKAYIHYDRAAQLEQEASALSIGFEQKKKKYVLFGILGVLFFTPIGLIIGIIYFLKKQELEKKVDGIVDNAQNEKNLAEQIIVENASLISVIPDDYWYPLATENIIKLLSNGRASSLNDALDRFDAMRREWALDEKYAAMANSLAQQTANLQSIERSSRISAVINTATAAAGIAKGVSRGIGSILPRE